MERILFTVPGCSRCAVVKKFMRERSIAHEEHDALGDGKALFRDVYRAHRERIVRGTEGVAFPVLCDGGSIRQGLAPVLARLQAGERLDGFFRCTEAPRGWVSGIEISAGDPSAAADLLAVLSFLKAEGLNREAATDGRNATLLEALLGRGLVERMVMRLHGPPARHRQALGGTLAIEEIEKAMALVTRFPEYRFETAIVWPPPTEERSGGPFALTPEETAAAARWLKEVTSSHRQPYVLIPCVCPASRAAEPPPGGRDRSPALLVRHRSAARTFQVRTEIAHPPAHQPLPEDSRPLPAEPHPGGSRTG